MINEIKSIEIQEIKDFLENLEEYGHIFHLDPKLLDKPFNQILQAMSEIEDMMDESFSM